ncbi:11457_t:CDS:2, partial [Racocetra persica]
DANNSIAELKSTLNKIVKLTEEYNPIDVTYYIDILENNIVIILPPKDEEEEPSDPLMQKRQESSGGSISEMILSGYGIVNGDKATQCSAGFWARDSVNPNLICSVGISSLAACLAL